MKYAVETREIANPKNKYRSRWFDTEAEAVTRMQHYKEIDQQRGREGDFEYRIIVGVMEERENLPAIAPPKREKGLFEWMQKHETLVVIIVSILTSFVTSFGLLVLDLLSELP